VKALFPGKQQPYVNSLITQLVNEKKLIREDTRPYTVHVPMEGEDIPQPLDYSRGPQQCRRKNNFLYVPRPSAAEVNKYLAKWDTLEHYILQEHALNKLFLETYTKNTQIEDVLIKVAALNDFYSTQIFSVYPVAKQIVSLNIDNRLLAGDYSLVEDIANVRMESGENKHFYSFATKYCSHHQPDKFAIFDSYVEKVLKYFRNEDNYGDFKDSDLKIYEKFIGALNDFKMFYELEKYSLKELDRYLWLLGKEVFPKNYK
jgi:hypothetical protein